MEMSKVDWHAKAKQLIIRSQMIINGELVDAASGRTFVSRSPIATT